MRGRKSAFRLSSRIVGCFQNGEGPRSAFRMLSWGDFKTVRVPRVLSSRIVGCFQNRWVLSNVLSTYFSRIVGCFQNRWALKRAFKHVFQESWGAFRIVGCFQRAFSVLSESLGCFQQIVGVLSTCFQTCFQNRWGAFSKSLGCFQRAFKRAFKNRWVLSGLRAKSLCSQTCFQRAFRIVGCFQTALKFCSPA